MEGRERASRAGFTCPPVTIRQDDDRLTLTGSTLRLIVHRPLWLEWQEKHGDDWRTIASDRPTVPTSSATRAPASPTT